MPFPWSKKVARVIPTVQVVQVTSETPIVEEKAQEVVLPTIDDKISVLEHKNGECLVDAREEDDEADEVQGHLQEGGWTEEGDHGGEEVVARFEDEESSSPRTPLKK